jgi:hypothetical protein
MSILADNGPRSGSGRSGLKFQKVCLFAIVVLYDGGPSIDDSEFFNVSTSGEASNDDIVASVIVDIDVVVALAEGSKVLPELQQQSRPRNLQTRTARTKTRMVPMTPMAILNKMSCHDGKFQRIPAIFYIFNQTVTKCSCFLTVPCHLVASLLRYVLMSTSKMNASF